MKDLKLIGLDVMNSFLSQIGIFPVISIVGKLIVFTVIPKGEEIIAKKLY